jgi:HD-GYP domain-containing protein (c-di-GMP phosphodiesterase class II)
MRDTTGNRNRAAGGPGFRRKRNGPNVYTRSAESGEKTHGGDRLTTDTDIGRSKGAEGAENGGAARGFGGIKSARIGFEQLLDMKEVRRLALKIRNGISGDMPSGPGLECTANIDDALPRSAQDIKTVMDSYDTLHSECAAVLDSSASATPNGAARVRLLAERCIESFCSDSNLWLNAATRKSTGGIFAINHSLNVCLYSIAVALHLGYSREQVVEICVAALLHDIGMLLVPWEIILKNGGLTQDEWFEIQKHPLLGCVLMARISGLPESVGIAVLQTHERENGKGYPLRSTAASIHRHAKIVQVADIYEALTSPRPYRDEHIPYRAIEMVVKMTRQGLLDGAIVKALIAGLSLFPVGSLVKLNDGRVAKVIRAHELSFAKPVVRPVAGADGTVIQNERRERIELAGNKNVYITGALAHSTAPSINIMGGF